jgi:hypothetical protein
VFWDGEYSLYCSLWKALSMSRSGMALIVRFGKLCVPARRNGGRVPGAKLNQTVVF